MSLKNLLFILLAGLFVSQVSASSKKPPKPPKPDLSSAQDTIGIAGVQLILETYLWRDFMPVSPPDGKPLRAVVNLIPVNSETLPPNITMDKIWIINGKEIWSDTLNNAGQKVAGANLPKLEMMAQNGPKWEPGSLVKVIVRVKDDQGKTYLLQVKDLPIHKTV
ncbi:MAG: hypothetical protein P8Y60_12265 [Calditrichota bacterium]